MRAVVSVVAAAGEDEDAGDGTVDVERSGEETAREWETPGEPVDCGNSFADCKFHNDCFDKPLVVDMRPLVGSLLEAGVERRVELLELLPEIDIDSVENAEDMADDMRDNCFV